MIGRQISFFFTPSDEDMFLQEIKRKNDLIITDKGVIISSHSSSYLNNNSYPQVWIMSRMSKIVTKTNKFIDRNESEVIEYSRSTSDSFFKRPVDYKYNISKDKRILKPGRLWTSMRYIDPKNNKVEKEKWFQDWYNEYVKWIKDNCRKSKDMLYFIGEDAYRAQKEGEYSLIEFGHEIEIT